MSDARQAAVGAVDLASKAAAAYKRPDLAQRLAQARRRLVDPSFHVFVVGEFKQGKSTLINGLLDAPICPVDDDVATSVPTAIRYAAEETAELVFAPDDDDIDAEPRRVSIPISEIARHVTEAGNPANVRKLRSVDVGIPRQLLQHGLVLVDTPGVGGLGSAHTATTIGALPMANAVLFVSDASQEFSAPELDFLKTARDLCPTVACVLTKIDFYPEWRTIAETDVAHLAANRVGAAIMPVSSALRARALEAQDRELNAESGFPALVSYLRDQVVADGERLAVRAAAASVLSVTTQLQTHFESEKQALSDPEKVQALFGRLQAAKEKSDRLRDRSSKWQQTLSDGFGDLSSDVEHDLRLRTREMLREADDAIDASDPIDAWDEFEAWVYRRATDDVTANYTLLQVRTSELAQRVAEHFDLAQSDLGLVLERGAPTEAFQAVKSNAGASMELMSAGNAALVAMRGGYGGMLMFGMLGQMVGLTMLNPLTGGMFLLMGKKSLKEEKQRQLAGRRAQAKNAVRKYVDEVSFHVSKDSRDTLRLTQRQLRDWFSEKAEELHRSTTEALMAAQEAATTQDAERAKRLADVEAEIGRISRVRQQAAALAPDLSATV